MDLNKKTKAIIAVRIKINVSIMTVFLYMPKAVPLKKVEKKKNRNARLYWVTEDFKKKQRAGA